MVVWNLSHIYDPKERAGVIADVKKRVEAFTGARGKLKDSLSAHNFLVLLKDIEGIWETCSRLSAYAGLWQSENTSDAEANAHELQIHQLCADLENEVLFFSLWFAKLEDKVAQPLIETSGKYRYYL